MPADDTGADFSDVESRRSVASRRSLSVWRRVYYFLGMPLLRFVIFVFNSTYRVKKVIGSEVVEQILADGRVVALKVYLGYLHYGPEHDNYRPYYELAERHHLPVIFHTGDTFSPIAKLKYAHPLLIDEVAVDHPNVRFVLPGRAASPPARSPRAIAPTSERTCPASASNASDPVRIPPTIPATSMMRLIAKAINMRRRLSCRRAASAALFPRGSGE